MLAKHRVIGILYTHPDLLGDANSIWPNKPPHFPVTTAALLLTAYTESGLASSRASIESATAGGSSQSGASGRAEVQSMLAATSISS